MRWDVEGLPDPTDHTLADWNGEPAYLAWHRRLNPQCEVFAAIAEFRLESRYAYAVPIAEALEALLQLGPLVEIGAGGGYWARLLTDRGGDVLAYDRRPLDPGWTAMTEPWAPVIPGGIEVAARHRERTLFVCWPPRPNGFMPDLLRTAPQKTLALITEGRSDIGDTDAMFDLLESQWATVSIVRIPNWGSRNDRLTIWVRRR